MSIQPAATTLLSAPACISAPGANTSVLGNGTLAGAILHAAGRATSTPDVEGRYFAGAGILRGTSNAFSAEAFSLSPHTRAVFSADVDWLAQLVSPRSALAVPEPASLVSLTCGLVLIGWRCRSRRTTPQ